MYLTSLTSELALEALRSADLLEIIKLEDLVPVEIDDMGLRLVLRQKAQGVALIEECPIPVPGRHEVLIRVNAVALNPFDWKMLYARNSPVRTVLGCDFAGTVEVVGEDVGRFKIGERVAGMTAGGKKILFTIRQKNT